MSDSQSEQPKQYPERDFPIDVTFNDFRKIKLVVGTILAAEPIPDADKLYKLTVDLGEATPRTICAGMKPFYQAEQLLGRQVVVVANLAPRKMRGIESNGMILAGSNSDHSQVIIISPAVPLPPGSEVS